MHVGGFSYSFNFSYKNVVDVRRSFEKANAVGGDDEGKSEIQKFDYLENEKNFLVYEVKSIFDNYLMVIS